MPAEFGWEFEMGFSDRIIGLDYRSSLLSATMVRSNSSALL
jgi:hypothetical protein